jgi:hypothetical protein
VVTSYKIIPRRGHVLMMDIGLSPVLSRRFLLAGWFWHFCRSAKK